MKAIVAIIKNFRRHENFYLSTHIAYCALLSMIPLLLIVFSVVGFVLGTSHTLHEQMVEGIADFLPLAKDFLTRNLEEVVVARHFSGLFGVFLMVFFATLLFSAVERALDKVFETERRRNFLHSRLLAIFLIIVISFLFFLPTVADLLTRLMVRYGFHFPLGDLLRGKIFFILFTYLAFVLVVMLVPHHRVRLRYALFGGFLFASGIFLAKLFFRWYMLRAFAQYNVIFGSVTAFVLLLLWIYYCVNILLLSAEVVAYFQHRFAKRNSGLL